MNMGVVLKTLGCLPLPYPDRTFLDENGYLILPGVMDPDGLTRLRNRFEGLCELEGMEASIEVHQEAGTRRLADLTNKGDVFDPVYTNPRVLAAIYHVIRRPFKLSSLNTRDALPGQGLHADYGSRTDELFHACN